MARKHTRRNFGMKGSQFVKPILVSGTTIIGFGTGMALTGGNPLGGLLGGFGAGYGYTQIRKVIVRRYKKIRW